MPPPPAPGREAIHKSLARGSNHLLIKSGNTTLRGEYWPPLRYGTHKRRHIFFIINKTAYLKANQSNMRARGQPAYDRPAIMWRGMNIRRGLGYYQRRRIAQMATAGRARGARRVRQRIISSQNPRIGGLLGIEKKYLDIPMTSTALGASTTAASGEIVPSAIVTGCYSAPAQGDGPTNRDGSKIVICEVKFKGVISVAAQADQTAADLSCEVFLCAVQDTQTNGTQLNSEDVFVNPSGAGSTATSLFRNISYLSRFRILRIKKMTLRIPTLTFDGTNIEQSGFHSPWSITWKGKIPVTFTTASTTADIANVTDNSIQFIAFCSSTSLAPTILGNCRMRFYG